MSTFDEIMQWFETLPASFAFLLALPFVIAFVSLLKDAVERRGGRQGRRGGDKGRPGGHGELKSLL
ncbi:hypothetical protein [Aromatoleum petrolei]|uniref:Uncharacterized protein n=1 Tax=Aromatoleum petrolei TaxID=76116 RepID=A0ABX1MPJ0_9RHOO|nr:hypothetical protein [Aromatoleum petrolei]NMF89869.1 hypothetical protein [Aromatoleum petrolei]QTQ37034.1 Uncharacterized protein ToN1_29020 [Aromatoleum petrolei]